MAGGGRDIKEFLEKNFEAGKVYKVSEVLRALRLLVGADVRIQHTTNTVPARLRGIIILYLEDRAQPHRPLILADHPPVSYDVTTVMVIVPPPPPATTTPTLSPPPSETEEATATLEDPPVDSIPSYDTNLNNGEVTEFGMPMGQFGLLGHGVGDVRGQHFIGQFSDCKSLITSLVTEDGRFGRKTSGVSVDSELTDKDSTEIIVDDAFSEDTDGFAGKTMDLDIAGDMSQGFPAYRGADMFWADSLGICSKVEEVVG